MSNCVKLLKESGIAELIGLSLKMILLKVDVTFSKKFKSNPFVESEKQKKKKKTSFSRFKIL